jgi:glycosyltransferase involved in cell wall biosynthesis
LKRLSINLGINESVHFSGKIITGISKYFLISNLFVLPGLGGLAIHHAMTHGLAVISGSADGTGQDLIIKNKNGYLLKTNKADELADLIEKFLLDRSLSEKFGKYSREIVNKKINIHNMVSAFMQVIEND